MLIKSSKLERGGGEKRGAGGGGGGGRQSEGLGGVVLMYKTGLK